LEAADKINLLAARNIHRNFTTSEGILEVLRGINLDVNKGDMVAVVGESGVGKSTLLHVLGGLDRPSKGSVSVRGEAFGDKSETELARFRNRHIGFVFQQQYLLSDFNALENVMMPNLIADIGKTEAKQKAEHLLAEVGLSDRMKHMPQQLSGGEQQRIAVARALANDPEIVIADEPSGNLDIKTGEKLHDLLGRLNEKHEITFLIATHNIDLAKKCRRVVKLENGFVREAE